MRLLACLIVAPQRGYDEPAILSYAISSFCPTSADGLQSAPRGEGAIPEKEATLQPSGGGFTPPSHEREPNCRDRGWQNAVYTDSDHPPAPTPENRMRRPTNKNAPGQRIGLGLLFSLG